MNKSRLFKLTTVVSIFIFTMANPGFRPASAETTQPPVFAAPQDPFMLYCASTLDKAEKALSTLQQSCEEGSKTKTVDKKQCMKDAFRCANAAREVGQTLIEDEGTYEEGCSELQKLCPEYAPSAEDAKQAKSDAKQSRRELQKTKQDDQKGDLDRMKQAQEEANKLDERATENDNEWRKNRQELTNKLQTDLSKIEEDKLKAVKEAQDAYDKIDDKYIQIRDQLRRKSSDTNQTELAWNSQCRAEANDVATQAEQEFDKRMAEEDRMIRNFQFSSSAGKMRRQMKLKRKRILNKFNEYLAKCLRGDNGSGSNYRLKLAQARNDLRDSQAQATDISARMEKLRMQMMDNLNQLKQKLDRDTQRVVQQTQDAINQLDQNHNTTAQQIEKQRMQAQMNAMMQSMQGMQKDKQVEQELQDARDEESTASEKALCARYSKEQASEKRQENKDIREGLAKLKTLCGNSGSTGTSACSGTSAAPGITNLCNQYKLYTPAKSENSQVRQESSDEPSARPSAAASPTPSERPGSNGNSAPGGQGRSGRARTAR